MNTGVQKLLSLGASLGIGAGLGLIANRSRDAPAPGLPAAPARVARLVDRPAPELERLAPDEKPLPVDARDFVQLSADEEAGLDRLIGEFRASRKDARRLEILKTIHRDYYGERLLVLVAGIFEAPELPGPELRQEAVRMLAGNVSPKILPTLNQAYARADRDEKSGILMAAARVGGREMIDFVARGFEDSAAEVRFAAMDVVHHQDAGSKGKLLVRALVSSYSDIALAALGELEVDASTESLPIIFRGLASPCSQVRDETKATLQFLIDEDFEDPSAATVWWQHNRHRFDRNLIRME